MREESLSTRRMLAESLYGMLREEYNQKQGRYRVPWDKLPEATRQIYVTAMARFLLKHTEEIRSGLGATLARVSASRRDTER